jgi:glycosyltransferase involved in cell wall biosynthesis
MTVDVSLLIPIFNRAAVLSETLDALTLVETHGIDWEVVIIDTRGDVRDLR